MATHTHASFDEATLMSRPADEIGRMQSRFLPLGALGLLGSAAGYFIAHEQFWQSYLIAYIFWIGVTLGSLAVLMVQHLSGGKWGLVARRVLEAGTRTLPLMAVLFIPIALNLETLYAWARPEAIDDELIQTKAAYLNESFFYLRAVGYFIIWGALTFFLNKWSREQDEQPAQMPGPADRRFRVLSGPGLVLYVLTITLMSVDWVMSLDPHWYSTIFGVYLFAGSTVSILALLILLGIVFERRGPLAGVVTPEHYHDLGKLLFGFVVFWAYIAFSQFMLIWYGNIPEETVWYAHRLEHGWKPVTLALALGHFVLPFFYLLSRDVKRRRPLIAGASVWLLLVHYLDLYWLVMPAVAADGAFAPHWLDLVTLVAVAGILLGAFGWLARRPALVPVADPRLPESLSFENM